MKSEVNRRRKGAQAIGWDSSADEFQAFEKKSLYAAGYIQGAEFILNVLEATPQLAATTEADIKQIAEDIKAENKRRRG